MWYLYIYPYFNTLFAAYLLLTGNMFAVQDKDPVGIALLIAFIISYIVAIIISLTTKKVSVNRATIVKLVHIPFYIAASVMVVILFITVMGIPLAFLLIASQCLAIIPSGIYMARSKVKYWQKVCGFVFVMDIVAAITARKEMK